MYSYISGLRPMQGPPPTPSPLHLLTFLQDTTEIVDHATAVDGRASTSIIPHVYKLTNMHLNVKL